MKKVITVTKNRNEIFKQQQLTIGVDLGDRISNYCILDETGNVILESGEIAKGLGLELRDVLEPLLGEIESLNERIAEYDRHIVQIAPGNRLSPVIGAQ